MRRFVFSVVALVGVLATAHPTFADPVATTASNHPQTTPAATQQPVTSAPAGSASSDTPMPASVERGKEIPVGFGWG